MFLQTNQTIVNPFKVGSDEFQLFVEQRGGGVFTVVVPQRCTVWHLKARIQGIIGVRLEMQRLKFQGMWLDDPDDTLRFYNIQNMSTLYLEVLLEPEENSSPAASEEEEEAEEKNDETPPAKMLPTSASSSTAQLNLNIWFLWLAYFCVFSLQTVVVRSGRCEHPADAEEGRRSAAGRGLRGRGGE